jgi:1-acyl-sn-glycerol-3-phosphate acyltransferase
MPLLPSWAWWLAGVAMLVALFVAALPWLVRPVLWVVLRPRYRFRFVGGEHLPMTGPALVASNHVTWIDGFLLAAVSPRRGLALVNADYISLPVIRWLARRVGLIPVPSKGPRAQRAAIEAVRRAFDRGEMVLIFPEAQLSRNGFLGPFYRGLEVMMKGHEGVPVIPVYLGGLWGSTFSFAGGRTFGSRPKPGPHVVYVAVGPPVPPPVTAFAVRQAVQEASVQAAEMAGAAAPWPDTIDLDRPHLRHPALGLLAASTADYDRHGIRQTGQKPGSVGQPPPGVALRAVNDAGAPLPPEEKGRLQARLPGRDGWQDTGYVGAIDREGFVWLEGGPGPAQPPLTKIENPRDGDHLSRKNRAPNRESGMAPL